MSEAQESLYVEDDGLICPEVGQWSEEKYRLISLYDELFSSGMKNKWDQRTYIDLYAAAGHSRIRGTSLRLKGSPILALKVNCPFDRYIFCEEVPERLEALKKRCETAAPANDIRYVSGSCDEHVDEICAAIPRGSRNNKVLSLCLVDPYDFGMKFETIRKLSNVFMDFVVLLAVGMDAARNYDTYVDGNSTKIDEALGNNKWRERWKTKTSKSEFRDFLAMEFAASMESLGYLKQELYQMKMVRLREKNLPLYYMALFSKHPTAYKFWDEVMKYSTAQHRLPWD